MTIRQDATGVIHIEGAARVEDAETLVAALQGRIDAEVDLNGCSGLHAAVLQALLVFQPRVIGPAPGTDLSWLIPILERPAAKT